MRIYLDNAATSFPKPPAVYDAVDRYQREIGVSFGRGSYREAVESQKLLDQCRGRMASLLGAERPDCVIFTFNGTDALNMALLGVCRPGDHVITSELEHNSVLRPLRWLREEKRIDVSVIQPGADGRIDPRDVRTALRSNTRLVAIQHASNVSGVVQPITDIGEIAQEAGAFVLVDAAQSAGQLQIDFAKLPIDLLACPGHKGLLGPLGTGALLLRPGVSSQLSCYRLGGTGTESEDDRQPNSLPERYESGNHNAPGLAGLNAALAYLQDVTIDSVRRHEMALTERLLNGLRSASKVKVYGHGSSTVPHIGVVSFNIDGLTPHEAASILDESFGVQARAGLHCAPGAHRYLGTFDSGGTIRFSVGPMTSTSEIDAAVDAVKGLCE